MTAKLHNKYELTKIYTTEKIQIHKNSLKLRTERFGIADMSTKICNFAQYGTHNEHRLRTQTVRHSRH